MLHKQHKINIHVQMLRLALRWSAVGVLIRCYSMARIVRVIVCAMHELCINAQNSKIIILPIGLEESVKTSQKVRFTTSIVSTHTGSSGRKSGMGSGFLRNMNQYMIRPTMRENRKMSRLLRRGSISFIISGCVDSSSCRSTMFLKEYKK